MLSSQLASADISWWIKNDLTSTKSIDHGKISHNVYTDESTQGWGASLNDTTTGGWWSSWEESYHINYLELKAILLGLQSLCKDVTHDHIRVMTDDTTAVAYFCKPNGKFSFPPIKWHCQTNMGVVRLANTVMVPQANKSLDWEATSPAKTHKQCPSTIRPRTAGMGSKLHLVACLWSGNASKVEEFHKQLKTQS